MSRDGASPPPPSGPARIAWLTPGMIEGSGGIRTMLQNAEALIRRGHRCDIYVDHRPRPGESPEPADRRVRDEVRRFFRYDQPGVYAGFDLRDRYDLVFATAWWTAPIVADLPIDARKAYFVQDFEAWFNPMGDGFLLAENSYGLGLTPVTIGRWLTRTLTRDFGCTAAWFDFGADHALYRPLPGAEPEQAVCFIHQPEKPRRCPRLGLQALAILQHRRPGVKVYLYGSRADPFPPRPGFQNRGLLGVEECNALYNRCRVGLCISSSNPSRIPFEMMAAGLPVVDACRENNLYDMPEDAVLLARQTPEAIAQALIDVLDNPARAAEMGRRGIGFMAGRSLEHGYEQFVAAVEDILRGDTARWRDAAASIEPMYGRAAVVAPPTPDAPPMTETLASELGREQDREVLEARTSVELIERSRSWRLLQSFKHTGLYRVFANARFGPGWDRVDPGEDPRQRLARMKSSRAFRLIDSMKKTGVYRLYLRRRAPSAAPGIPEERSP